jgi:hypothetical protein
MIEAIRDEADARGITRLCHFTPSRNLVHILTGDAGVLPTRALRSEVRAEFSQNDLQRLDGYEGHVCCTVEYPNAWYLVRAQARDTLFPDWVVLLVARRHLYREGTLFCPRNAAAGYGSSVQQGSEGFRALYKQSVVGQGGVLRNRTPHHLACSPTDDQAEVLVPGAVPLTDVRGIVVADESQAKREALRIRTLSVPSDRYPILIAPVLFQRYLLSAAIRKGERPAEMVWTPPTAARVV